MPTDEQLDAMAKKIHNSSWTDLDWGYRHGIMDLTIKALQAHFVEQIMTDVRHYTMHH